MTEQDDVLTLEMLKKALNQLRGPFSIPPVVIHSDLWEDYKKSFNFTEEQMKKHFVKATFIPWDN